MFRLKLIQLKTVCVNNVVSVESCQDFGPSGMPCIL